MNKAERQNIVDQAIANERLEGLEPSQSAQKIANDYASGKISAKEAARKIRAHYGIL